MLTDAIQKELPGQVDALYTALRDLVAAADPHDVDWAYATEALPAARRTLVEFEDFAARTAAAAGLAVVVPTSAGAPAGVRQ